MKHTKMLLALLLPMQYMFSTAVTWEGATATLPQINSSIVSVTNQDLIIRGDVQLPLAGVTISALTTDVNVTFMAGQTSGDTIIYANDLATLLNQTGLNLVVAAGHNIIFHINPTSVIFRGTNLELALALMINAEGTAGGSGQIQFVFEQPNKTLQFTALADSGGTKFYAVTTAANGTPRVLFQTPSATNQVMIGANGSLLGAKVAGLTNAIYDCFVFDATGAPQSNANLVIKSFGSIGLQTTT